MNQNSNFAHSKKFLTALFIGICGLSSLAIALPDDNKQPIHITANSTTYNYKTGSTIYEGNVRIDQGTTTLTADRVITNKNNQNQIEEAIAYGTDPLAEYSTVQKKDEPPLHAKAKTIKFYPLKAMVVLEEDVTVSQGKNSFQGPVITYNIKDQIVTAPASKVGRSTIIIQPDQIKS